MAENELLAILDEIFGDDRAAEQCFIDGLDDYVIKSAVKGE